MKKERYEARLPERELKLTSDLILVCVLFAPYSVAPVVVVGPQEKYQVQIGHCISHRKLSYILCTSFVPYFLF